MIDLSDYTILIIECSGACTLRERLINAGASVHVVKPAGALTWARCKKIDAAFISLEDASNELCAQLTLSGAKPIIMASEDMADVASSSTSWRSILGPEPARRSDTSSSYLH